MPTEVVTYKPGAYCQLKLASGERILISCAQSGIKVMKLGFGGLFPTKTLAVWSIAQIDEPIRIFAEQSQPSLSPLEAIKNRLSLCVSVHEVQQVCAG